MARFAKNLNAAFDAQLTGDGASIVATTEVISSPEHIATFKRISEYCGLKM